LAEFSLRTAEATARGTKAHVLASPGENRRTVYALPVSCLCLEYFPRMGSAMQTLIFLSFSWFPLAARIRRVHARPVSLVDDHGACIRYTVPSPAPIRNGFSCLPDLWRVPVAFPLNAMPACGTGLLDCFAHDDGFPCLFASSQYDTGVTEKISKTDILAPRSVRPGLPIL
jgi:hypothetical protein